MDFLIENDDLNVEASINTACAASLVCNSCPSLLGPRRCILGHEKFIFLAHFLSLVKIAGSPQYLLTVTATEAAALGRSGTVTGRRPAVSWPRRAAAGTGRKLLRLEAARGPGCHVQATGYAG